MKSGWRVVVRMPRKHEKAAGIMPRPILVAIFDAAIFVWLFVHYAL